MCFLFFTIQSSSSSSTSTSSSLLSSYKTNIGIIQYKVSNVSLFKNHLFDILDSAYEDSLQQHLILHNRNNNHTKSNVTYHPLPHHHLYDVIPLVILPMHKLQGTLMTQVRS
jgi:hypothetical protein